MATNTATVSEVIVAFLEAAGVDTAFGVASIHNIAILDAVGRRGKIRFVPARGEAGAASMADAFARISGKPGVVITSTGPGAGNAAGGIIEALSAGSPVIHLTGQVALDGIGAMKGILHEVPDQLGMLRAISKAAFRIDDADGALDVMREAVRVAMTPPRGPVSVEVPADLQVAEAPLPDDLEPLPIEVPAPDELALDRVADGLAQSSRPLMWLGGGAAGASQAVRRLAEMGVGVIASQSGRGILDEDHPMSLGWITTNPPVNAFMESCDAMLMVGSHPRDRDTLNYRIPFPNPLYLVDVDPAADGRTLVNSGFVCGDAPVVLDALADRLEGRLTVDPAFAGDLAAARTAGREVAAKEAAPYAELPAMVRAALPRDAIWANDNSLAIGRLSRSLFEVYGADGQVTATSAAIGMGLPMAIGAALGAKGRKVALFAGDGGLFMSGAEFTTLAQEKLDVVIVVMNDRGYGIIKMLQHGSFDGRDYFADLFVPDLEVFSRAHDMAFWRVGDLRTLPAAMRGAAAANGPALVEIDMNAIGPWQVALRSAMARKPA